MRIIGKELKCCQDLGKLRKIPAAGPPGPSAEVFFYFLFSAVRVVGSSHLEGKGEGAADQ
jgi:hypothetical protein